MKKVSKSTSFLFALLAQVSSVTAATTFTYTFDSDLEGWTSINSPTTGAPGIDWASNADGQGSGVMYIANAGLRDQAGDLALIGRSPEFSMVTSASNAISFSLLGGAQGLNLPTDNGFDLTSDPTISNGGFQGMALRRVSDGVYLLGLGKSSNGATPQTRAWTSGDINTAIAGSPSDIYTLDLVDTAHTSWGWVAADSVNIRAEAAPSIIPEPSSSLLALWGAGAAFMFRRRKQHS